MLNRCSFRHWRQMDILPWKDILYHVLFGGLALGTMSRRLPVLSGAPRMISNVRCAKDNTSFSAMDLQSHEGPFRETRRLLRRENLSSATSLAPRHLSLDRSALHLHKLTRNSDAHPLHTHSRAPLDVPAHWTVGPTRAFRRRRSHLVQDAARNRLVAYDRRLAELWSGIRLAHRPGARGSLGRGA